MLPPEEVITLICLNIGKSGRAQAEKLVSSQGQITEETIKQVLDIITNMCNKEKANILVFQEVDLIAQRSRRVNCPRELAEQLNKKQHNTKWYSFFAPAYRFINADKDEKYRGREFGNAVLTNLKIS